MASPEVNMARAALKAGIRGLEGATNRPLEVLTRAQVEVAIGKCQRALIEANNALAGKGLKKETMDG